ncbi:MAG: hypothetical protein AAFY41_14310, partial [Bacteroidota bacterium]
QTIRIGKGFLEFLSKADSPRKVLVSDMLEVRLDAGEFSFKHQDSKAWSGKGKYRFLYGDMPNAKLFLVCLSQVAGITL